MNKTKRYTLTDDQVAIIMITLEAAAKRGELHETRVAGIKSKLEG